LVIAAGLIGTAIGWFLSQWKTAVEITNLKSETANNIAQFIQDIQSKHELYNKACIKCREIGEELVALLAANAPVAPVDAARGRFCAIFLEEVIISFHNWMEIEVLRYKADHTELESLLTEELSSECRKFAKWLRTMNNPVLLQNLQKNPVSFDHAWLKPFYRLSAGLRGARRQRVDEIIKREVNSIINAGHSPMA